MIDFWDISKECQIQLKTIKVRDKEYNRLKQELYRRKKGDADRASYLASERQKTEDKLLLLQEALEANPKAKQKELAAMLGISERTFKTIKITVIKKRTWCVPLKDFC